jgi:hypothetical protein
MRTVLPEIGKRSIRRHTAPLDQRAMDTIGDGLAIGVVFA